MTRCLQTKHKIYLKNCFKFLHFQCKNKDVNHDLCFLDYSNAVYYVRNDISMKSLSEKHIDFLREREDEEMLRK